MSVMRNVIAVDPGVETGLAWASLNMAHPKVRKLPSHRKVQWAFEHGMGGVRQFTGNYNQQVIDIVACVQDILKRSGYRLQSQYEVVNHLVIEDFHHRAVAMKDTAYAPVEVTARLEFYIWWQELDADLMLERQQPSEQAVVTDENLRHWDLWTPGKSMDDAMTALKHVIVKVRKLSQKRR